MINSDDLRAKNLSNGDIIMDMSSGTKGERTIIMGIPDILEGSEKGLDELIVDSLDSENFEEDNSSPNADIESFNERVDIPPYLLFKNQSKYDDASSITSDHKLITASNPSLVSKPLTITRAIEGSTHDESQNSSISNHDLFTEEISPNHTMARSFLLDKAKSTASLGNADPDSSFQSDSDPFLQSDDGKGSAFHRENNNKENSSTKLKPVTTGTEEVKNEDHKDEQHDRQSITSSLHVMAVLNTPTKMVDIITDDLREINRSLEQTTSDSYSRAKNKPETEVNVFLTKSPTSGLTDLDETKILRLDVLSLDDSFLDLNCTQYTNESHVAKKHGTSSSFLNLSNHRDEILQEEFNAIFSPDFQIPHHSCFDQIDAHSKKVDFKDRSTTIRNRSHMQVQHNEAKPSHINQLLDDIDLLRRYSEWVDNQDSEENQVPMSKPQDRDFLLVKPEILKSTPLTVNKRNSFIHNTSKETISATHRDIQTKNDVTDQLSFLSIQPSIQITVPPLPNDHIPPHVEIKSFTKTLLDSSRVFQEENHDSGPLISADSMMELIAQNDGFFTADTIDSARLSSMAKQYEFETQEGLIKTLNSAFELDDNISFELKEYDDLIYSFTNEYNSLSKQGVAEIYSSGVLSKIEEDSDLCLSRSLRPPNTGNSFLSGTFDLFMKISSKLINPLYSPESVQIKEQNGTTAGIDLNFEKQTESESVSIKDIEDEEVSEEQPCDLEPRSHTSERTSTEAEGDRVSEILESKEISRESELQEKIEPPKEVESSEKIPTIPYERPQLKNILRPKDVMLFPEADRLELITISNINSKGSLLEVADEELSNFGIRSETDSPGWMKSNLPQTEQSMLSPADKSVVSPAGTVTAKLYEDIGIDGFMDSLKQKKPQTRHFVEDLNHQDIGSIWDDLSASNRSVNPQSKNAPERRKMITKILFSSRSKRSSSLSVHQGGLTPLYEEKHSLLSWPRSLFRSRSFSANGYSSALNLDSGESLTGFAADYSIELLNPVGRGVRVTTIRKKTDSRIDDIGMIRTNGFKTMVNSRPTTKDNAIDFSDSDEEVVGSQISEKLGYIYAPSPFPALKRQHSMFVTGSKDRIDSKYRNFRSHLVQRLKMKTDEETEEVKRKSTIRFAPSPMYIVDEGELETDENIDTSHVEKRNFRKASSDSKHSISRNFSSGSLFGSLGMKSLFQSSYGDDVGDGTQSYPEEVEDSRALRRRRSFRLLRKLSIFKRQKEN